MSALPSSALGRRRQCEKSGHFGKIVALLRLAATTSGISPRSGPDDSKRDEQICGLYTQLLDFMSVAVKEEVILAG